MFQEFTIPHAGLKLGHYQYDFFMGDAFFKAFVDSEFDKGRVQGRLELEKKSNMLDMFFTVKGEVEVLCDRCSHLFDQWIDQRSRLIVQFGEDHQERDEEVVVIPFGQHEINVAQYFYEFINLAVPLRRVHPERECDGQTIERLNEISTDKEENNIPGIDPRWEKLRGLGSEGPA